MKKKFTLALISAFFFTFYSYSIDAWIRINQLGYLPTGQKKAILLSKSVQNIKKFYIYDALTNKTVAECNSVVSWGEFETYKSTFILDFSTFTQQGAYYIKAGLIYSPTLYINKNTYLGSADFLLNYLRQQRVIPKQGNHQYNCYETTGDDDKQLDLKLLYESDYFQNPVYTKSGSSKSSKKNAPSIVFDLPKQINLTGGWTEPAEFIQYGSTSAVAVYQLLFAYQMNPESFADNVDASGKKGQNGIPDILDEAKWGLDWLMKMYPGKDVLYHQIGDNRENDVFHLPYELNVDYGWGVGYGRSAYLATSKPQGVYKNKNHSNGIASVAGKYASCFALGSQVLARYYPNYADSLIAKATDAYQLGKKYPGVCQSVPGKSQLYYEEDNWSDDMELAAAQLYQLTYDGSYLKDASKFGRMEPVSPWLCSDTTVRYQWFPFINMGHFIVTNVENPRFQKEFKENLLSGIHRMSLYASTNPFDVGVPMVMNSNNMVVALASQCKLYRTLTNDSSFIDMENNLIDWLFGRNPWGISMVVGLPKLGSSPVSPHASIVSKSNSLPVGALIGGAVNKSVFDNLVGINLSKEDQFERFQTNWAVYHDDINDLSTNEPTLDGTASLTYLLSCKQLEGVPSKTADWNQYTNGAITRTDPSKKQVTLVFSGHEYSDGYKTIRKTLKKLNIKASFFFTGDFYRNPKNAKIIKGLQQDNHFLGGNSDKHLLYCSLKKRDSLLINKSQFLSDLRANYKSMEKFGIKRNNTPFFLPSFESHNDSISTWCKEVGLQLINYTPGTLSNTDISIPEMRDGYYSSDEIYNRIMQVDARQGLNGSILLFHMGSDDRRQDKFYPRLYSLLIDLSKNGYDFVDLYKATDAVDKNTETDYKQKRKN